MKKIRQYSFIITFLWSAFMMMAGVGHTEVIRSFDSIVQLQKDASLNVTETIVYDFQSAKRHGIFRFIPIKYNRHHNVYSVYVKVIDITNEDGQKLAYQISKRGHNICIKIGDPHTIITGTHTYKIHYIVLRAVNFFDNAPEVFWNVTGNSWDVPIDKATAQFLPPDGVDADRLKIDSFYGILGSTTRAAAIKNTDKVLFSANNLGAHEGLTFVVRLPANLMISPPAGLLYWWIFLDWWPTFVLPFLALIVMITLYILFGRDKDGKKPIAVELYPPRDLSPAEVGTLINERCDTNDIISTLLDLAARGYLQIHERDDKVLSTKRKDYTFVRNPEPEGDVLSPHERSFLERIFEKTTTAMYKQVINDVVKNRNAKTEKNEEEPFLPVIDNSDILLKTVDVSDLKRNFHNHIPTISHQVYAALVTKRLFWVSPEFTRNVYLFAGGIVGLIGVFLWRGIMSWGIGFVLMGAVIAIFYKAMPAKTAKGSAKLRECKGFAQFVKMAEKRRLKMMQDEDPQIFGRLLPYAVALGVADEWAKGFEDLLQEQPNWFRTSDYGVGTFSATSFVSEMNRHVATISSAMTSQPSSQSTAGGGFSGGGFGGGGGGSW